MSAIDNAVSADEILPGLFVGNWAASQSQSFLKNNYIKLVVNATANIPNAFSKELAYVRVPVNDPGSNPGTCKDVRLMKFYLPKVISIIQKARKHGYSILVHCHAGMQRSACIVAAYLLATGRAKTVNDAVHMLVEKRKVAFNGGANVNFKSALEGIQS